VLTLMKSEVNANEARSQ